MDRSKSDVSISPFAADRNHRSSLFSGCRKGGYNSRLHKGNRKKDLLETPLIPPCAKGMSAESLSRFLKAKGKLLQEELEETKRELQMKNTSLTCLELVDVSEQDNLCQEMVTNVDECKKLQQDLRLRDEEKLKSTGEIANFKEKVKKLEIHSASLAEKLQMRDSENAVLKKEIEILKQDMKKTTLSYSGQESRLNKAKEENENLRHLLKQVELNEKEAREKFRKKNEEMLINIRKLEKQKNELVSAIKKQVVMIENFKKQKGLLEAEGALNFTEKDFLKILGDKLEEERK